jgi:hypothetical protein
VTAEDESEISMRLRKRIKKFQGDRDIFYDTVEVLAKTIMALPLKENHSKKKYRYMPECKYYLTVNTGIVTRKHNYKGEL